MAYQWISQGTLQNSDEHVNEQWTAYGKTVHSTSMNSAAHINVLYRVMLG